MNEAMQRLEIEYHSSSALKDINRNSVKAEQFNTVQVYTRNHRQLQRDLNIQSGKIRVHVWRHPETEHPRKHHERTGFRAQRAQSLDKRRGERETMSQGVYEQRHVAGLLTVLRAASPSAEDVKYPSSLRKLRSRCNF